jgi:TolA-binding protein
VDIVDVKKIPMKEILEIENLGKRTGTTDTSIINRIQEMEEKISSIEGTIEEINASFKENIKSKIFLI